MVVKFRNFHTAGFSRLPARQNTLEARVEVFSTPITAKLVRFDLDPTQPLSVKHMSDAPNKRIFDPQAIKIAMNALGLNLVFNPQSQLILTNRFNQLEPV